MISIKPHHFVDIVAKMGSGQTTFEPHPYGHAVHVVAREIHAAPHALLRIELGADAICEPCAHNCDGVCDDTIDTSFRPEAPRLKQAWNLLLDQRWCRCLGLQQGDVLSSHDLCLLVRDHVHELGSIYPEMPGEWREKRADDLRKGIACICRLTDT